MAGTNEEAPVNNESNQNARDSIKQHDIAEGVKRLEEQAAANRERLRQPSPELQRQIEALRDQKVQEDVRKGLLVLSRAIYPLAVLGLGVTLGYASSEDSKRKKKNAKPKRKISED